MNPRGREILLGVSGGIGAYKAPEIVRLLRREGLSVQVILTRSARWFVSEGTLQTLSERPVFSDLFQPSTAEGIEHIDAARRADLLLVAPATAHLIARLALGLADDFLTTVHLAFRGPVLLAPAMNTAMFHHPAVRQNLTALVARGVEVIGPDAGELACGEEGEGRLVDPPHLVRAVLERLARRPPERSLSGRRVLVGAGPTREAIDPVRFLSNPSTGRMGFALAEAALRRGAEVTVVCGPTPLPPPAGARCLSVTTAREMREAMLDQAKDADLVLMAAAVGDWEVTRPAAAKIKKTGGPITLELSPAPDILAELGLRRAAGEGPILVGFAAETDDLIANASAKLSAKHLDYVVANPIVEPGSGFGSETNRVTVLSRDGRVEEWPLLGKDEVAARLLDRIVAERFHSVPAATRPAGSA